MIISKIKFAFETYKKICLKIITFLFSIIIYFFGFGLSHLLTKGNHQAKNKNLASLNNFERMY